MLYVVGRAQSGEGWKGGGGGEGWVCFSEFFLDDKTAAAAVFSSCSFVPLTLFGTSLVMASYYGYEIWHQK